MTISAVLYANSSMPTKNAPWIRLKDISVRMVASVRMISPHTKALYNPMINEIQKRCCRCGDLYDIPNIRESSTRERLIDFYPCMHCGFIRDIQNPKKNTSGRCRDCAIPFSIINHHAKGRCNRCYMNLLRNENATKLGEIVRI